MSAATSIKVDNIHDAFAVSKDGHNHNKIRVAFFHHRILCTNNLYASVQEFLGKGYSIRVPMDGRLDRALLINERGSICSWAYAITIDD